MRSGDPWSLQAVTIGQPAVLANGRLPRTPSTRGWSEALRPRRWALMELRTPVASSWRPLVAALLALALGASSCGSTATPGTAANQPNMLGNRFLLSSGGGPLAQVTALTKRFTELHPGLSWSIENVGSDAGITLVG